MLSRPMTPCRLARAALLASLALGAMSLVCAPTFAQEAAPPTKRVGELTEEEKQVLTTLLAGGNDAYDAGKYADALAFYEEARALIELPILVYRMAFCFDQLDRREEAVRFYKRFLELDPEANDRGRIERDIARLEAELARARVAIVTITSEPSGATVSINGKEVGKTPLTKELEAGPYTIDFSLEDHLPKSAALDARGGEEMNVSVELREPEEPYRPARVAGWSLFGAGVLAGGAAVALTSQANAETERYNKAPNADPTLTVEDHGDMLAGVQKRQTRARASQGIAIGITGIGASVLAWSYFKTARVKQETAHARKGQLHLAIEREEVNLGWTLRF